MLELTGASCSGVEAIEFMESLEPLISVERCQDYEKSLNRFRYEISKSVGKPVNKINKVKSWYHDIFTCGKCGRTIEEATWKYCPNCGTMIIRK